MNDDCNYQTGINYICNNTVHHYEYLHITGRNTLHTARRTGSQLSYNPLQTAAGNKHFTKSESLSTPIIHQGKCVQTVKKEKKS